MSSAIGLVTRVDARQCWVRLPGGEAVRCAPRGRLFQEDAGETTPVAVGDRVVVRREEKAGEGTIEGVLPRRTKLSRRAVRGGRRREQVVVANPDRLGVIVSAARPPLRPGLIDRYLILAAREGLTPLVVVNKVDLVRRAVLEAEVGVYRRLGHRVVLTSALTGEGVDELRPLLAGKLTAFSGQSGVGKSSLLNALAPELRLPTRPVSRRTGKGVHTTTQVTLYVLAEDTYVVDTPGIRALGLWDVRPEEVDAYFEEITRAAAGCRFRTCRHREEPDCAVREAVRRGEIDRRRFASYLRILAELEAEARRR